MTCTRIPSWLALSVALALAACGESREQGRSEGQQQTAATPSPNFEQVQPSPPSTASEDDKGEAGARKVLLAWARALERKDFAAAYAALGKAAREGTSPAGYAARFAGYRTIAVSAPTGQVEGAAGSLYYEVPVKITGTANDGSGYAIEGLVVLRQVNDVPGATPEQLRWHIERTDLKPVN